MKTIAGVLTLGFLVAYVVAHRAVGDAHSLLSTRPIPYAYFEGVKYAPWGRVMLLIVGMLLGILFGHLHSAVLQAREKVKVWRVMLSALASGSLWASLFASPILFGVVYTVASSQPDIILAAVFSFENGFFCQRILERRAQEFVHRPSEVGSAGCGPKP